MGIPAGLPYERRRWPITLSSRPTHLQFWSAEINPTWSEVLANLQIDDAREINFGKENSHVQMIQVRREMAKAKCDQRHVLFAEMARPC
jgi:hypothetical protein